LKQSFTARMPLMATTNTFGSRRRRKSSPQQCYLHRLYTIRIENYALNNAVKCYSASLLLTYSLNCYCRCAAFPMFVVSARVYDPPRLANSPQISQHRSAASLCHLQRIFQGAIETGRPHQACPHTEGSIADSYILWLSWKRGR